MLRPFIVAISQERGRDLFAVKPIDARLDGSLWSRLLAQAGLGDAAARVAGRIFRREWKSLLGALGLAVLLPVDERI